MNNAMLVRQKVDLLVRMLTRRKIQVTMRGTGAKVQYDDSGVPVLVNIPYIPDNATPEFLAAIEGFLDHEVSHVLHTDPAILKQARKLKIKQLHNLVEDVYIEKKMAQVFQGSALNLSNVQNYFLQEFTDKKIKEEPENALGYIMIPAVRAFGGQAICEDYMRDKWHLLGPVKDRIEAYCREAMQTIRDSAHALEIALEMKRLMDAPDEKEEPPEKGEGGEKGDTPEDEGEEGKSTKKTEKADPDDSGEDEEDSAEGEDSESDDSAEGDEEEGAPDEEDEGKDKGDEGDEDEEASGDEDDGEGGESDDDEEDDSESDGDSEDDSESDADEGGSDSDSDDDADDDESDSDGEDEGEPDDEGDEDDDAGEPDMRDDEGSGGEEDTAEHDEDAAETEGEGDEAGEEADPDTDPTDDVPDEAGELMPDLEELLAEVPDYDDALAELLSEDSLAIAREAPYFLYTTDFDRIEPYNKVGTEHAVQVMTDTVDHMLGSLQKDLERAIAAQSKSVWHAGLRSGRMNPSALARLTTFQDDRAFRRKHVSHTKETAVELVVDCSGSMRGRPIQTAAYAAYGLAAVLERIGVPCEIIGFTTCGATTIPYEERVKGIEFSRLENLYMPIFKTFDQRLDARAKGALASLAEARWLRENVDGESVAIAAGRLAQRREARKIMIVLSDGEPACSGDWEAMHTHLKTTVREIEKSGIDVLGIGIESNAVSRFYKKHVVLRNMAELPTTIIRQIKELLTK